MKVSLRGQRLVQISKTLPNDRSQGESLGLLKFDEAGSAMLFKAASQLVGEGFTNQWAPAAVDRIAPHHPIRALDVSGLPWTEIDYIEDALFAKYEILPAVLPSWRRARRPAQIGRIRNFARQFFATVTSVGSVLHDLF